MAEALLTRGGAGHRRTDLAIIDCDVHPMLPNGKALTEYLPANWRTRFGDIEGSKNQMYGPRYRRITGDRITAAPPGGGPPASDPHFLIKDLIEPNNIAYTLLLPFQMQQVGTWVDPEGAAIYAEAFNRYFGEHWLFDSRFRLVMIVAPQDPELAAAEIRRFGRTPGVSGVWVPWALNVHLGRPHFRPIFQAAAELGLPIITHGESGGANLVGQPDTAGGVMEYSAERNAVTGAGCLALNNLISLVFSGTFERFPTLKMIFIEAGFTWAGQAMWRMDKSWRLHRSEVPWMKKPPSEYVIEHCRFTTQPMPEPEQARFVLEAARHMHAERTLLFTTDYPHWDSDDPKLIFRGWPADLKDRVFRENALETFGSLMPRTPNLG